MRANRKFKNVILTEAIAQWKDLVHRHFSYPDPSAPLRCAQDDTVKKQ